MRRLFSTGTIQSLLCPVFNFYIGYDFGIAAKQPSEVPAIIIKGILKREFSLVYHGLDRYNYTSAQVAGVFELASEVDTAATGFKFQNL